LKRHAFVLAGWVRVAAEAHLSPIVIAVSNALDEHWQWEERAANAFRVIHAPLKASEPFSLTETGASLTASQKASLQRKLMACAKRDLQPLAVSRLLTDAVRQVAAQNGTVGENILAVSLPREATKTPPVMSISRDLAMQNDTIAVLNYRAAGDPLWHAPHLVGGDMEFMHVTVGTSFPELGPDVPIWMLGPVVLSRRTHSPADGIIPDLSVDHVPGGWSLFAEAAGAICESLPGPCVVSIFVQPPPLRAQRAAK
jgi:hypothetical protein